MKNNTIRQIPNKNNYSKYKHDTKKELKVNTIRQNSNINVNTICQNPIKNIYSKYQHNIKKVEIQYQTSKSKQKHLFYISTQYQNRVKSQYHTSKSNQKHLFKISTHYQKR